MPGYHEHQARLARLDEIRVKPLTYEAVSEIQESLKLDRVLNKYEAVEELVAEVNKLQKEILPELKGTANPNLLGTRIVTN